MPAATNGMRIGLSRYSNTVATAVKDSHCTAAKRGLSERDWVISGKIRENSCSTLPLRKRELNLSPSSSLSYRDAGVDIDAGDRLVENIKPFAKRTMRPEVLNGIGGFGALVEISKKYREPVLVSGTDGVGTKLKLAFELNRHDTVGIDLVGM